jgi:hypothetical protein
VFNIGWQGISSTSSSRHEANKGFTIFFQKSGNEAFMIAATLEE